MGYIFYAMVAQILLNRALFRQFTALVTINHEIIASCNTATPDMGEKMQNLQQIKHPANDANPDIVQTDMKKKDFGHHSRINITLRH